VCVCVCVCVCVSVGAVLANCGVRHQWVGGVSMMLAVSLMVAGRHQ